MYPRHEQAIRDRRYDRDNIEWVDCQLGYGECTHEYCKMKSDSQDHSVDDYSFLLRDMERITKELKHLKEKISSIEGEVAGKSISYNKKDYL